MATELILAKLSQLQEMGERFIGVTSGLSGRIRTLEAVGAQANLIERILVNGDVLSIGADKSVNIPVPTRVNQLENDASYQENKIETIQVNGSTRPITNKTVNIPIPTVVSAFTNDADYQTNVLEGVKVNGTTLTVDGEKNVDISVPTKVSQLTNDKTYQTKSEVATTVNAAIAASGHASFQKVSAVPAVADAKENILYLVMNSGTKHYDIYAKIKGDDGNFKMELLDDTTVDLSGYVTKETGKGLSHNDFTDALKTKLEGIADNANKYIHPGHTAYAEGLYKVTVDALGHLTKATAVTKADITALGIPGQDTHDWASITGKPGSFTPASHTHDDRYYTESEIDQKLSGLPTSGHTHAWADITGKPSTFTPSAHKHVKADITDFPTSMPASDVPAWAKASSKPSYGWSEIQNKPSSYTPASHTHTKSQITDFPTLGTAAAKAIRTLSAVGASGWKDQATDDGYVPTMSFMAYWNGAYSGSSSNLAYCNKGAFGTAATKNTGDFAAASHSHTTVNGHSVNADVPSGAKFTDTNTWRGIQNNLTSDSTSDSLSAAQGKVLKGLVDGKAPSSHTHNYAGSGSAGGTANSVNGFTFGVQTSDPGANSSLTTNKFLFVYE